MASLFEINQEILSCIDSETGEIIDADRLDQLLIDRKTKLENVALWIKNLESDVVAMKAEIEAFTARKKAAEAKIESLKLYLANALQGEKFSTTRCAVSFRSSEETRILDKTIVPKKYLTKKVTYEPNKAAIKEAIKSGLSVKGAELVSKLNPQIK